MIIKKQRVCDICGKEITNKHNSLKIKATKGWSTWDIDGFEKTTIDICSFCANALKERFKAVSLEAREALIEKCKTEVLHIND